jgi:hypothetical protein
MWGINRTAITDASRRRARPGNTGAGWRWEETTMTAPARDNADDPGPPGHGTRKSDPLSPGWANYREAAIAAMELAGIVLADLAARPGDAAALRRADLITALLREHAEIGRRCTVDEAVFSAERARAYAEGVAYGRTARKCFEVIDGGQGTLGPH